VQKSPYQILSYRIEHSYGIKDFLSDYRDLLQKAIDVIWDNIDWIERAEELLPNQTGEEENQEILLR